ncbi:protein IQ-DOMAIN 33 isoform X2 [Mercurialis annua]|uniref:protein IQ-DOMAIN 33 isoform X2 n=1 Tax=Mercurialis annua TaxID=3986 RepID=UPI0021603E73|nr:protein IQ-DOMAIN 33 isoform X2 [Mercurialis annua]
MGITGGLVRSAFSRNRSARIQETSVRNNAGDKKRWTGVRSYLCGDELLNSVAAEEDSDSVKCSEETVTQPVTDDSASKREDNVNNPNEKHNSTSKLFQQDDAAITIQSAFRDFMARRRSRSKEIELKDDKQELVVAMESPGRDSVGTSIEVQTGNSVEVVSVDHENSAVHFQMSKKARTQIFRIKEDWDDSTASSNAIRRRIQNRMEATNRRERALAYAFAQQLRICSKKKQTRTDGTEQNMGWSWLERWMATRIPDTSLESHTNSNHKLAARKRFFDIVGEERESCGSNEVSVQFDSLSMTAGSEKSVCKNRIKPTRAISRRKTVPRSEGALQGNQGSVSKGDQQIKNTT